MQRLSAAECERRKKIQFHSIKIVWKSSDTSNFFSHNELHFVYAFVCVGVCTRVCLIFLRCLTRAINVFAYGKTFWNQKNSCAAAVFPFNFVRSELFSTEKSERGRFFFSYPIDHRSWITIVKVEFHQLKWQWLGKVFFISWLEKIFSNCNKIDGNSISQSVWICTCFCCYFSRIRFFLPFIRTLYRIFGFLFWFTWKTCISPEMTMKLGREFRRICKRTKQNCSVELVA